MPVRRLTACKYIQESFFRQLADDFPMYRNDSYLHVKYRKRMPQPMGGCAVIMGSTVPLVGMDYGVFSLLFLHKERDSVLIHQGTLRYFSEKNPERPSGVRFFSEKFLAASSPNLKG